MDDSDISDKDELVKGSGITEISYGNRLIHLPSLTSALNSMATCEHCLLKRQSDNLEDFFMYVDDQRNKLIERANFVSNREIIALLQAKMNVRALYKKWMSCKTTQTRNSTLCFTEITYGLATKLEVFCSTCSEKKVIEARKTTSPKHTLSEICKYDINLQFALPLQQIGVGGQHAGTITSFLDLPDSHKWSRQFSVLEKFMYPTVEALKCKTQIQATEEEILETLDLPNKAVDQFFFIIGDASSSSKGLL